MFFILEIRQTLESIYTPKKIMKFLKNKKYLYIFL